MSSIDPYFRGRINRKEFFLGVIGTWLAHISVAAVASPFAETLPWYMTLAVGTIVTLPLYALTFSFYARRLHDVETSGWMSLAIFIPLINIILFLVLLFKAGTKGKNKYGPQPTSNRQLLNTLLFPTH